MKPKSTECVDGEAFLTMSSDQIYVSEEKCFRETVACNGKYWAQWTEVITSFGTDYRLKKMMEEARGDKWPH